MADMAEMYERFRRGWEYPACRNPIVRVSDFPVVSGLSPMTKAEAEADLIHWNEHPYPVRPLTRQSAEQRWPWEAEDFPLVHGVVQGPRCRDEQRHRRVTPVGVKVP